MEVIYGCCLVDRWIANVVSGFHLQPSVEEKKFSRNYFPLERKKPFVIAVFIEEKFTRTLYIKQWRLHENNSSQIKVNDFVRPYARPSVNLSEKR